MRFVLRVPFVVQRGGALPALFRAALSAVSRVDSQVPALRLRSHVVCVCGLCGAQRQQRLVEEYNFTCSCARCREEASWSDDEDEACVTCCLCSLFLLLLVPCVLPCVLLCGCCLAGR